MKCFTYFVCMAISVLCQRIDAWADTPTISTNSIGMKLVLVPAGEFVMGSPEREKNFDNKHSPDEMQHRVQITHPYFMGVHTVTQSEYQQVMGTNPSSFFAAGQGKERVRG